MPSYRWTVAYGVVGLLAALAPLCIAAGNPYAARKAKAPEQPVVSEMRAKVGV